MKKKLFAAVCTCFLVVSMVVPVVAIEPTASDVETITPKRALIVSNPETGEQWNWDLQAEDISVKRNSRAADGNSIKEAAVNVDVGEYLRRTMTIPVDGEETIRYEVPILCHVPGGERRPDGIWGLRHGIRHAGGRRLRGADLSGYPVSEFPPGGRGIKFWEIL